MTETHKILSQPKLPSYLPKSTQNNKHVTMDNGIAAILMNGILLPFGFLLLSDKEAISGSVTASKIRLVAVIMPKTVIKPPNKPGTKYGIAPDFRGNPTIFLTNFG